MLYNLLYSIIHQVQALAPFDSKSILQTPGSSVVSDVSREVKERQRKQRAREQLLKLNQRKREEKIASYQDQLERLAHLQQLQETEDAEDFQLIIEEAGYETAEVNAIAGSSCFYFNCRSGEMSTTVQ